MKQEQIVSRPLELSYKTYQDLDKDLIGYKLGPYTIIQQLGKGGFGTVYLAKDQKGMKFALKVLDLKDITYETNPKIKMIKERLAISEPKMMMLCDSPNLIKCYDIYENKDLKILVMEYCNGENLQTYRLRKKKIPERQAVQIMRQIINGVSELHRHKIVHRDLKAQNIMEHQGQYKIIDFGFSKKLQITNETDNVVGTLLGTPTTMAPEVMFRKKYGLKADIWSIGIIFFELVFGIEPYDSSNARKFYAEIQQRFKEGKQVVFNKVKLSSQAHDFLRRALKVNPDDRLGWRQLVGHPFIKIQQDEPIPQRFIQRTSLIMDPDVGSMLQNNNIEPSEYCVAEELPPIEEEPQPQLKKSKQPKLKLLINEEKERERQMERERENERQRESERQWKEKQSARRPSEQLRCREERLQQVRQEEERAKQFTFVQCQEMHLDCLKAEFIFKQLFLPIERRSMLNLEERDSLQFMYLLISRAFKNMSPLKLKMRSSGNRMHRAYRNLAEQIESLYLKVSAKFKDYDEKLRAKESKYIEVGKDFFSKIFWRKYLDEKNKFISGVQKMVSTNELGDYILEEHIDYTCDFMERNHIKEHLVNMGASSQLVKNYLTHYRQLMLVNLDHLEEQSFADYVREVTKE